MQGIADLEFLMVPVLFVLQMSDTLELSSWATCRLVAGQAILMNMNYDTLRNRWAGHQRSCRWTHQRYTQSL